MRFRNNSKLRIYYNNFNKLKIILIIFLVAFIFWYPILLTDKIPWIGDISRQYFPWYLQLHQSLSQFRLPFWIPEMGAGYPLLAEGEVGVFYPLNFILIFLFSPLTGFKLYFPIHTIIATIGVYLIGRKWKLSKEAALFSGLVFAYSFFFTIRSIHPSIIAASSWLPYGIYLIELSNKLLKPKLLMYLSFVIALQLIVGHPQIAMISLSFYLVYFLLRLFLIPQAKFLNKKKFAGIFLLAVFLGLGLAGLQVLPTLELSNFSSRAGKDLSFIFSYSLPKSQYLTYLFPYLFGITPANSNLGYLQFGGHFWEFALYIGIMPLILALVGLTYVKHNRYALICAISIFIFALAAIGGYLQVYRVLVRLLHLPFRVSARFILPLTLSISLLAGIGLNQLLTGFKSNYLKVITLFTGGVSLFLLLVTFTQFFPANLLLSNFAKVTNQFLKHFVFTEFQRIDLNNFSLLNYLISLQVILLFVSLAVIFLHRKSYASKTFFVIAVFGLFFIDPFLQGFLYQTPVSPDFISEPEITTNMNWQTPTERMFTFTEPSAIEIEKLTIQPNINLIWNISSFNSITPLPLKFHEEVNDLTRKNLTFLNILSVKYVLSPTIISVDNLNLINKNNSVFVYQNQKALPRAYLVFAYEQVDEKQLMQKILNNADKLNQKVIISSSEQLPVLEQNSNNTDQIVKFDRYDPTEISILVNTKNEGILVLTDSFYPGWRAYIDEKETQIFPANGIFRGIFIPKGNHQVEFRYISNSFYLGLGVSLLSGIAWVLIYFLLKELL